MANPIVTFEMENGDIMKAELYPEIAPNTVNNFISLINKVLRRSDLSPCDPRIYDPGRMSERKRNGWSGIRDQRRVCTERFPKRSCT